MYIFKRQLWLLVENKLLGAKVETVERLLWQSRQKVMVAWIKVLAMEVVKSSWFLDVFLSYY